MFGNCETRPFELGHVEDNLLHIGDKLLLGIGDAADSRLQAPQDGLEVAHIRFKPVDARFHIRRIGRAMRSFKHFPKEPPRPALPIMRSSVTTYQMPYRMRRFSEDSDNPEP